MPEFAINMNPDTPCNSFLTSLYQKNIYSSFLLHFGLVYVEEETYGQMQLQVYLSCAITSVFCNKSYRKTIEKRFEKRICNMALLKVLERRYLILLSAISLTIFLNKELFSIFTLLWNRLDLAEQAFKNLQNIGLSKRSAKPQELNQTRWFWCLPRGAIRSLKRDSSDLTDHSGYNLNRQAFIGLAQ